MPLDLLKSRNGREYNSPERQMNPNLDIIARAYIKALNNQVGLS